MNIKRALLSVYDKTGITDFARALQARGIQIISSGSTYDLLREKDVKVVSLEEYAALPDTLGKSKGMAGKGIVAAAVEQSEDFKFASLDENSMIPGIDLIAVNLNPFEDTAKTSRNEFDLIKSVDIGRHNLIRAASKNYRDVVVLTDPYDYSDVVESLDFCGDVTLQKRRLYSLKGFYRTMHYDAGVHDILSLLFAKEKFDHFILERVFDFDHGENYQQDAYYSAYADDESGNDEIIPISGKKLTFNDYNEINRGLLLLGKIEEDCLLFMKNGHICAFETIKGKKSSFNFNHRMDNFNTDKGILFVKGEIDANILDSLDDVRIRMVCFDSVSYEIFKNTKTIESAARVLVNCDEFTDYEYKYLNKAFLVQERDSGKLYGKYRHINGDEIDECRIKDVDISMKIAGSSVSLSAAIVRSGELIGISQGNSEQEDAVRNACARLPKSKGLISESVIALDMDPVDFGLLKEIISIGFRKIVIPGRTELNSEISLIVEKENVDLYFSGRQHFSL